MIRPRTAMSCDERRTKKRDFRALLYLGGHKWRDYGLIKIASCQIKKTVTGESYQQNLANRRLAILVLPFASWPKLERHKSKIVAAIEALQPGG
jgi:hypothetical protein